MSTCQRAHKRRPRPALILLFRSGASIAQPSLCIASGGDCVIAHMCIVPRVQRSVREGGHPIEEDLELRLHLMLPAISGNAHCLVIKLRVVVSLLRVAIAAVAAQGLPSLLFGLSCDTFEVLCRPRVFLREDLVSMLP